MIAWVGIAYAEDPPASTDESWLDAARPEDVAPAEPEPEPPAEEPAPSASERGTFGTQLDVFGLEVSWSGYGDLVLEWAPTERELTFEASHFNPILGARLSDRLYAEVEIEFEDAGTEVKLEYGILDYTPVDAFGLRIGQFLVPIGEFNADLHPSFRWVQVSRPEVFTDVVPAVWSESGVQARGALRTGDVGRVRYAAYVCNGLGSDFDVRAPDPVRAVRDNAEDENYDLAVGGQLGYVLLPGRVGETAVAFSAYSGAIDATASQRLAIGDVSVSTLLGPVTLRGEAARSYLNPAGDPLDPFEEGLYGQVAVAVGRFTPSVRFDRVTTGLEPATMHDVAGTLMVKLATFWNVRAEGVATFLPGEEEVEPKLLAMSAFFF